MADRIEFTDFARDASRGLLRSAWLLTGDWAAAEDLVQVALVATWRRWDAIEPGAGRAYSRRVMLTTFLRLRRRRWSDERPEHRLPEHAGLERGLGQVELRESLRAALMGLSRQQRAVVVLRYFEDLSEASTAEVLGCSVGAVKSHGSRALKALRATPGLQLLVEEGST